MMNLKLEGIYNQLVSLDPTIRRWALEPVASLGQTIGTGDWQICLYGTMAVSVARHLGQPIPNVDEKLAATLLRLPQKSMLYDAWDSAPLEDQQKLREAIRAFYLAEQREHDEASLIAEIEAMGDPLASDDSAPPETIGVTGRRNVFASALTSATIAVALVLSFFGR